MIYTDFMIWENSGAICSVFILNGLIYKQQQKQQQQRKTKQNKHAAIHYICIFYWL